MLVNSLSGIIFEINIKGAFCMLNKRIKAEILLFAMLLVIGFIMPGCATTLKTDDGLFEYYLTGIGNPKVVYISNYLGTEYDLIVPDQIGGYIVRAIRKRDHAYLSERLGVFENRGLTSVVLPNSLWNIQERAFANNNLTSITIPDEVTINSNAFAGNQITTFNLGRNLKCSYVSSLGEVTAYYYGNNRRAGEYSKIENNWFFNGVIIDLPAVIIVPHNYRVEINGVTLRYENNINMSMSPNNMYFVPAGSQKISIKDNQRNLLYEDQQTLRSGYTYSLASNIIGWRLIQQQIWDPLQH